MGKFKAFLKTKTGFATIHKNDTSDDILKPKNTKPKIGFATIDLLDDSDKYLTAHHVKKLKEDTENRHVATNLYHRAYLNAIKKEGNRGEEHRAIDNKIYSHHNMLNLSHAVGNESRHDSPIVKYTVMSKHLNEHLLWQHQGRKHPLYNEDPEYYGNRAMTHERHHQALAKETNRPENALKKKAIVHSGVGAEFAKVLHNTHIGEHVHFPAYTSATTHHNVAKGFVGHVSRPADEIMSNAPETELHYHMIHFHLPKGYTKGRHVESVSYNPTEHEMILHHGQTFKKVGYHHEIQDSKDHPGYNGHWHHHHFVPVEE